MTTPYDTFKDSQREFDETFKYTLSEKDPIYGEENRREKVRIQSHHRAATVALLDAVIAGVARKESKWVVHEIHGECGRTRDGKTLYRSKVREKDDKSDTIAILKDLRDKISSNE